MMLGGDDGRFVQQIRRAGSLHLTAAETLQ